MGRGTGTITPPLPREGGQPCGCDPKENHPCEEHARFVDESETEIEGGYSFSYDGILTVEQKKQPLIIVVTGPDREGEIGILASDCAYLPRFVALDLAREILRRLEPREGK